MGKLLQRGTKNNKHLVLPLSSTQNKVLKKLRNKKRRQYKGKPSI